MADPAAGSNKPSGAEAPRYTARLRYARISARKMRVVVDLIRGKDYNTAISILRACPKRGAMYCKKLLEGAFGNATDISQTRNIDLDGNKLHVVEARVDPGPIIKRWRPSSVRRPYMIKKRMCHVFVALQEREPKESRQERARRQQQERQKKAAQVPRPQKAQETAGAGGKKADQGGKEEAK